MLMDSSFWVDKILFGQSIVNIWGYLVILLKTNCILLSEYLFLPIQTVKTQMKCRTMRHFIKVFTVSTNTVLGIFRIQRVKICIFMGSIAFLEFVTNYIIYVSLDE